MDKPHETLHRIERLRQLNSRREWENHALYRLMYKQELYVVAYERIKSKPGNMTPGTDGETLDGWSPTAIETIIQEMRSEQFQFKPVRTDFIPKPNGKMRKLGIPSVRDKVVQEVMRMILEAIYDSPYGPYFLETSHGFRPDRSCHTALQEIRGKWTATNWFIEGDIHACFDDIDHKTLVNLLRRKIKDERFLNLIWKLLRAGYFDLHGTRKDSLIGVPQGGIVSPILANIYLQELDEKVEEIRQRCELGKKKGRNPLYRKLAARKALLAQRGETTSQEFRALTGQMRKIPAVEVNDPNFIRIRYCRYADDWLIGICGSHALAQAVKTEIGEYLADYLHLTLSEEKTHITHARMEPAKFLGTRISIGRKGEIQRVAKVIESSGRVVRRRTTGSQTVMNAPLENLIQRLHEKGFCTTKGSPTTKLSWINLDADQIVSLFNGINRGLLNYYRFVDNIGGLNRIQYILRFSLARTLAAKYRISVKRVFGRFGADLTITVKRKTGQPDRYVSFHRNMDWEKRRNAFSTNNGTIDRIQLAIRLYSRSKLGKPCCICGATNRVEMHHVRHVRKMGQQKPTGFTAVMRILNRKQIPACKACHDKIHRGEYDGISLSEFAYDPR